MFIAQQLYPDVDRKNLTEDQKQTISALGTLAAGLAGGVAGDSTADAVAGAQAGKNSSENNNLGGLGSYGQAAASLGTSMLQTGATTEEINAALSKNAKGDLPEGANISKAIVEGYKDGVLIAVAAYLGPAATAGKVIAGSTIGAIANGTYQWFDINSEQNKSLPENQQKTWDYWSSASATITGGLAPGRELWQNVGIAAGSAVFTDGTNVGAVSGAAIGAGVGGAFGKYIPVEVDKIMGSNKLPGFIFDITGSLGGEVLGGYIKDGMNGEQHTSEIKKEDKK
ncbi:VENN motif pre-toxin domain-containing protein [Erwinia sp. BNK-24-b]|uniref:VENN motif pre-toxin domain-containing protein n=1 Tax=unclassified Erwinia TaxID=2622719 RepID=UPI0039BEE512